MLNKPTGFIHLPHSAPVRPEQNSKLAAKGLEVREILGLRPFWISNTDIQSKYGFAFVMLLFSTSDTDVKGSAPDSRGMGHPRVHR